MFDKLKKSHRPYAKKILSALYPDNQLDADSICSKFVKKYHTIVKASIKDLENCKLIQSSSSKETGKLYSLSTKGKNLMSLELHNDTKNPIETENN